MLKRIDNSAIHDPGAFAVYRRDFDEGTSAVSVEGELDLSSAPRLRWMLMDALDAGVDRLVVDLSHVTFMDSTALGVLVGVQRKLAPEARLAIVCTRENVLQIFEFSGIDGAFSIYATLDQALAHVRGDSAQAG